MRFLWVLLFTTGLLGQRIDFGVDAGVPITEAFRRGGVPPYTHGCFGAAICGEYGDSATRRYVIGPAVGVRMRGDLWLDASVLYRRLGYDTNSFRYPFSYSHTATTANSWELPVVAKYRTHWLRAARPYGVAGLAFRHIGGFHSRFERYSGPLPPLPLTESGTTAAPPSAFNPWTESAVVGLGLEFRASRLLLSPEIRYNRWLQEGIGQFGSDVRSERNQIDFLLRVRFR